MKAAIVALTLLGVVSLVGCSQNAEVEKARAEAEAAKNESAKVKGELELLKAQLAALEAKQKPSPAANEETVKKAAQTFFDDLRERRFRSAYQFTSLAYQKRTALDAFEKFVEMHPALKFEGTDSVGETPQYKIRKIADNTYECDFTALNLTSYWRRINITLRVIIEDGGWKIDDFVEVKERKV